MKVARRKSNLLILLVIIFVLSFIIYNIDIYFYEKIEEGNLKVVKEYPLDRCYTNLICFNWSPCMKDNTRYRYCYLYPRCDNITKIKYLDYCDYQKEIHCYDNIKNYDETDIDCGGSCLPCSKFKKCIVDEDCLTLHCHPFKKVCVGEQEMPSFISIIVYKYSIWVAIIFVLLIPTIIFVRWLIQVQKELKDIEIKREREKVKEFYHYLALLKRAIKFNDKESAEISYKKILDIVSDMNEKSLSKVLEDFKDARELYLKFR